VDSRLKEPDRQSYTQVFRSGGIEAVSGALLVKDPSRGGFYAWGLEGRVIAILGHYQRFWQSIGVVPPMLLGMTVAGVKGWSVLRGLGYWNTDDVAIDRDIIHFLEGSSLGRTALGPAQGRQAAFLAMESLKTYYLVKGSTMRS
jgi:hypothetical protein